MHQAGNSQYMKGDQMAFGTGGGLTQHRQLLDVSTPHVASEIPPVWEKIAEITASTNVSSMQVTGLDLSTDKAYYLVGKVKNASTTSGTDMYVEVNGDTTLTNYYRQWLYAGSTSITAGRTNTPAVIYLNANNEGVFRMVMQRTVDGKVAGQILNSRQIGPSIEIENNAWCYNVVANVTSIELVSSVANAIAAGSTLIIYRRSG